MSKSESQDEVGYVQDLFLTPPPESFLCAICLQVLKEPKQCVNGHIYCKLCIYRYLETKSECPQCRCHITRDNMGNCLVVQEMIAKLPVKCPNVSSFCFWTGALELVSQHRAKCVFEPTHCENKNCSFRGIRSLMNLHKPICQHRILKCSYEGCEEMFSIQNSPSHDAVCLYKSILCPNNCGETIKHRKNVKDHLSYCSLQVVECPLKSLCTTCSASVEVVYRKDLQAHMCTMENVTSCMHEIIRLREINNEILRYDAIFQINEYGNVDFNVVGRQDLDGYYTPWNIKCNGHPVYFHCGEEGKMFHILEINERGEWCVYRQYLNLKRKLIAIVNIVPSDLRSKLFRYRVGNKPWEEFFNSDGYEKIEIKKPNRKAGFY